VVWSQSFEEFESDGHFSTHQIFAFCIHQDSNSEILGPAYPVMLTTALRSNQFLFHKDRTASSK